MTDHVSKQQAGFDTIIQSIRPDASQLATLFLFLLVPQILSVLIHGALDPVDCVLALVGELNDVIPRALLRPWAPCRLLSVSAQHHLTLPQHETSGEIRTFPAA